MAGLRSPSLDWLLVFLPLAPALAWLAPGAQAWIFTAACLAIIPLARWLGRATEHLARHTGDGLGGLLNATFGNAAELIIALMAMRHGLDGVVKASLTGSIIGNVLLVLGGAFLAGGVRHKTQRFNASGARTYVTMLRLGAVALVIPAAFHALAGTQAAHLDQPLSLGISVVLTLTYLLSLWFSLHTHAELFTGPAAACAGADGGADDQPPGEAAEAPWSLRRSLATLAVATALVSWMSEILVAAVEPAAAQLGWSTVFIGIVVVAIIGNAAEHATAIMMARRDRMDLAIGISLGSSIQIALFVAPVLVFLSYLVAPHPLDLVFTPAEVLAVVVAVMVAGQVTSDGESNWLEGVQLLSVYLILAAVFYLLPAPGPAHG
jgi:Ca2+:H+ antiporter